MSVGRRVILGVRARRSSSIHTDGQVGDLGSLFADQLEPRQPAVAVDALHPADGPGERAKRERASE